MPGIYTGIGSRVLPSSVLEIMRSLGRTLAKRGYKLRTGDAPGADRAFAEGAASFAGKEKPIEELVELFAPFGNTRFLPPTLAKARRFPPKEGPVFDELMQLLQDFHPLQPKGKGLHYSSKFRYHFRNPLQLFGEGMDKPSDFVLAAVNPKYFKTKNIRDLGGTGQNLRIAAARDIPRIILNPEYPSAKRFALLDRLRESNPDIDWEKFFKYLEG